MVKRRTGVVGDARGQSEDGTVFWSATAVVCFALIMAMAWLGKSGESEDTTPSAVGVYELDRLHFIEWQAKLTAARGPTGSLQHFRDELTTRYENARIDLELRGDGSYSMTSTFELYTVHDPVDWTQEESRVQLRLRKHPGGDVVSQHGRLHGGMLYFFDVDTGQPPMTDIGSKWQYRLVRADEPSED